MDNAEIDIRMSALTDMVESFEQVGAPGYTRDSVLTYTVMCSSIRKCIEVLKIKKVSNG